MTLMELLERFVAAHEKQAEAAMLMAQGGATAQDAVQSDGTECTAGKPAGHMMAMQNGGPATEKKPRKKKVTLLADEATEEMLDSAESPTPVQPTVEEKPAAPEITAEQLKAAAGLYCARRKVAGSEAPAGDCAALLRHFAGVGKTAEVPANLRKACLDAFEANWMPQEEDL